MMNADRIGKLRQIELGRSIFPQWKLEMERVTGLSIDAGDLLSLEQTASLRDGFFARVRASTNARTFAAANQLEELLASLAMALKSLRQLPIVLLHSKDRYIGALRIPDGAVLRELAAVWKVAEEDLCIATADLQNGFCLGMSYYDETGEYCPSGVYEFSGWGQFASF